MAHLGFCSRYNSIRTGIAVLFFVLVSAVLSGETICLVTSLASPSQTPDAVVFYSALEGGIMDACFEAGHIVFNAGLGTAYSSPPLGSDSPEFFLAKQGGANILVEVILLLRLTALDREVLTSVKVRCTDLIKNEVFGEYSVEAASLRIDSSKPEDVGLAAGLEAGRRLILLIRGRA